MFLLIVSHTTAQALTQSVYSVIVVPPVNKTGSADFEWLSCGIQDSMTVDLWSVSAVRTRALTDYGSFFSHNLEILASFDSQKLTELALTAHVDYVWKGEYWRNSSDTIILTFTSIDTKSGKELHRQKVTGRADDLHSLASRMVAAMISANSIPLTSQELENLSKSKTNSLAAFKYNSLGMLNQLQLFKRQSHNPDARQGWLEACEKAVELDPNYAEAHVNLGWAYYSNKSSDAALKAFTTAVTLKPHLLDGWMGIGYVNRDNKQVAKAVEAFKKAIAINGQLDWPRQELKTVITLTDTAPVVKKVETSAVSVPQADNNSELSAEARQLIDRIEHEPLDLRIDAIAKTAAAKGNLALPFLKQMINRQDQAFEVLKRMVDISISESAPYLIEVLEKRNKPDNTRLSNLNEHNVLGILQLMRRRASDQSLHPALPVLILTLSDKNPAIRESVAVTLGDFGLPEAVEPLKKFVSSEKNKIARMAALVSLTKLGDTESREKLKAVLVEGKDLSVINYATKLMKQRNIRLNDE